MTCPKCGFEQPTGEECRACGIIFSKYRPQPPAPDPGRGETERDSESPFGGWRYYFRIFRWFSLCVGVLVLVLLFWPASPPEVRIDAGSIARVSAKMQDFRSAVQSGRGGSLELSEPELNAWIQTNLDLPSGQNRSREPGARVNSSSSLSASGQKSREEAEPAKASSTIRDIKVALLGDRARTYIAFDLYGKEMSFQLEGYLGVENGYLRLQPVAGKIGSLPIPAVTLTEAVNRIFNSAENREKFRLPDAIEDIRVVDSQLKVRFKNSRIGAHFVSD